MSDILIFTLLKFQSIQTRYFLFKQMLECSITSCVLYILCNSAVRSLTGRAICDAYFKVVKASETWLCQMIAPK